MVKPLQDRFRCCLKAQPETPCHRRPLSDLGYFCESMYSKRIFVSARGSFIRACYCRYRLQNVKLLSSCTTDIAECRRSALANAV